MNIQEQENFIDQFFDQVFEVKYIWMRHEIMGSAFFLSNRELHKLLERDEEFTMYKCFAKGRYSFHSIVDDSFDYFFDDINLGDMMEKGVAHYELGQTMKTMKEVESLTILAYLLNQLIRTINPKFKRQEIPNEEYYSSPFFKPLLKTANFTYRECMKNETDIKYIQSMEEGEQKIKAEYERIFGTSKTNEGLNSK
ncbi:hypothetical protein [Candidatus Bandiella euplotis]|uniref:Uncharacterized protein n=1 Tax=Candidatus Bandiella euplotis TaxID=1664265 RepID=A0ABZ0URF6_9RICK|nr:hypothetical protein [Candidatus Bandiella woodruffii]WPX97470.1 hypothetical protein Bandiella_01630 [Candidatus Bandiella woodruffii]